MITTCVVAVVLAQPPEAATVLVTVYVPGVLAVKSITPVVAVTAKPVVEENVPAVAPGANAGVGLAPPTQYAPLAYEKVATAEALTVMLCVAVEGQGPLTLYVTT